jgi:hypothetical protein
MYLEMQMVSGASSVSSARPNIAARYGADVTQFRWDTALRQMKVQLIGYGLVVIFKTR